MIFAMRLLASNAAAYALLALGPLTAYSQDAALETHGIAVANMDRSINPGDDFYHYANGTWIQTRTRKHSANLAPWHVGREPLQRNGQSSHES
jgi:hypothetical protein